ncbi:uncharacterized protein [Miscanthus floridulus]|uniref:uncharacterized protein n=1 Tax=Miscanthus floridulus TaxID=154761 RepID=UPI00345A33B1
MTIRKCFMVPVNFKEQLSDWWELFQIEKDVNQICWKDFKTVFRSYDVPEALVEIKEEEFLNLKQGYMIVCDYHNKFTQLSCYAPREVVNDAKKQKRILKGSNDELQLQLMTVVYPDFQTLVNRAILIENKHQEMEEKKRRIQSQSVGSNTRPRYTPQQEFQQRYQEPTSQWDFDPPQQLPQYQQEQQYVNQNPPQEPLINSPMKDSVPNTLPPGKKCYRCGEPDHYASQCPKKPNKPQP